MGAPLIGKARKSATGKKGKKAGKDRRNGLADELNKWLTKYAELTGLKNQVEACRKLGFPDSIKKCQAKQLSGYIGDVKAKVRKLRREING